MYTIDMKIIDDDDDDDYNDDDDDDEDDNNLLQVKRDRKSSLAGNTSFIFPGRRVASAVHNRRWVS